MYILLSVIAVLLVGFVIYKLAAGSRGDVDYDSVSADKAREMLDSEDVVFLDVRTPKEVAEGMIDGAQTIDVMASGFSTKVDKLDKNKTYVVYCRSGRRSANACNIMSKKGFSKLHNLTEGFLGWS